MFRPDIGATLEILTPLLIGMPDAIPYGRLKARTMWTRPRREGVVSFFHQDGFGVSIFQTAPRIRVVPIAIILGRMKRDCIFRLDHFPDGIA